MFKDALGNIQFELWQGIKINGRAFQSLPLFNLCREFGDAQVLDACVHLGCFPCIADLSSIRHECERAEARYV